MMDGCTDGLPALATTDMSGQSAQCSSLPSSNGCEDLDIPNLKKHDVNVSNNSMKTQNHNGLDHSNTSEKVTNGDVSYQSDVPDNVQCDAENVKDCSKSNDSVSGCQEMMSDEGGDENDGAPFTKDHDQSEDASFIVNSDVNKNCAWFL